MAGLLIPLVLGALGWISVVAHRSLCRRRVSRGWHVAFFTAMLAGLVAGVYFGFFFRYFVSKEVEIVSFPVPAVFIVLEKYPDGESQWTDFVTPAPILFAGSNIPIFACLAVLPVWFANTLSRSLQVVSYDRDSK